MFTSALADTGDKNAQLTFKPEYVVPTVMLLSSDLLPKETCTGGLYEVSCGWLACTRLLKLSILGPSKPPQDSSFKPVHYSYGDKEVIIYSESRIVKPGTP